MVIPRLLDKREKEILLGTIASDEQAKNTEEDLKCIIVQAG
jgi:hypothetical protein